MSNPDQQQNLLGRVWARYVLLLREKVWSRWATGLVLLMLIAAIVPAEDPEAEKTQASNSSAEAADASTDEGPTGETGPTGPSSAVLVELIDSGDYDEADEIGAQLEDDDRQLLRAYIAYRIAKGIRRRVRTGDLDEARGLVIASRKYPATAELKSATKYYRSERLQEKRRVQQLKAKRAAARKRAREKREARARARREREESAYEAPSQSGPSTENWCGKRDGDGDGIYCEGE